MTFLKLAENTLYKIPKVPLAEAILRLRGTIRNLKEAVDSQNKKLTIIERSKLVTETKIYEKASLDTDKNSIISALLLRSGQQELECAKTILQTVDLYLSFFPLVELY